MQGDTNSNLSDKKLTEHINFIYKEFIETLRLLLNPKNWWVFIPLLVATGSVYTADALDLHFYLVKGNQENAAFFILGMAICLLIYSVVKNRDIVSLFLLILAINFFIREMDAVELNIFGSESVKLHTKGYIYIALAIMGIWAFFIKEKLIIIFNKYTNLKICFLSMLFTYIFSQAIARRLFKHIPILPYEHKLHIIMEETTENFAHLFFVVLAVLLIYYNNKNHMTSNKESQH